VAQEVELLLCKREDVSSNSSSTKKKCESKNPFSKVMLEDKRERTEEREDGSLFPHSTKHKALARLLEYFHLLFQ
jgi:hypothetical protein